MTSFFLSLRFRHPIKIAIPAIIAIAPTIPSAIKTVGDTPPSFLGRVKEEGIWDGTPGGTDGVASLL